MSEGKCAMDLALTEALHARPASMLVRLAARQAAEVELSYEGKHANAKKIIEVLRLGAKKGGILRVVARGDGAAASLAVLTELVRGGFVSDALPESGTAAALGIAVGRASWLRAPDLEMPASLRTFPPPPHDAGSAEGEQDDRYTERRRARLREAFEFAGEELGQMLGELGPSEAQLFEPELVILVELMNAALARVDIDTTVEAALDAAAAAARTERSDLVRDAYARVRARLGGIDVTAAPPELLAAEGERVLVTDTLTPSLLVKLPRSFVGIVASDHLGTGYASHAAILARGRGLPLVFAPSHAVEAIADDDMVVIESTVQACHFWVSPSAEFVVRAQARRQAWLSGQCEEEARAARTSSRAFPIFANVSARDERVPDVAAGVGLLRTELVFVDGPPSEAEQVRVYADLARRVSGKPCVVRLFDAGGDKPLPWIPAPSDRADLRGVALLFANPEILRVQLAAVDRARASGDVRILIPMVRSADDVARVRRGLASDAPVGAMIESAEAVRHLDAIARVADFISIGTNDLAASVLGVDRTHGALAAEDALLVVVRAIVDGAHAHDRKVTVCGELAADPEGASRLVGLGVDALSVTSGRVASLELVLSPESAAP
ncbi:MAG TPA: HPr family phosphocarrier protein [Polyangiaceae bacterium]|nr:HPr family phosphocarrier protein [Polyangiaceae bacterium]